MKILKKLIFISFFLCLAGVAKAEVQFVKFEAPGLKTYYCGSVMDFRYCKCAWHNIETYCEAVGMDQGSAAAYVNNGYSEYVNNLRQQRWADCKGAGNAYWDTAADGCTYCIKPHYLVDQNRCEDIVNLCSEDPLVMWNDADKECYCPKYYEWNEKELTCDKIPEVELKIEHTGSFPLYADGKTEIEFKITLLDTLTGKPKAIEEFQAKSSMGYAAGTITSTEGDIEDGYTVKYKTPDLRESGTVESEDFLAIFYINSEEEKVYETYSIALAVGDPFTVNKTGFAEGNDIVVFASPRAKIKVVTEVNGEKVPVRGATVLLKDEIVGEETDEEGLVELEKDNAPDGDQINEVEIVLELSAEVKKYQKDAQEHYGVASSAPINAGNATVSDFINNFAEKLAKAEDSDEAQKSISGLRRTAYACFFIGKGGELADDAAANIGKAIDTQIGDVISLLDPITALTDKISEGLKGKYANKEAVKKVTEKLSAFAGKFVNKLSNMLKGAIKNYAPSFDTDALVGMFAELIPNSESLHEDYLKNPGEDAIKSALSVEKKVTEYFMNQYKTEANAMLATIASQITTNNFDPTFDGTELGIAKDNFVNMTDKYLQAHAIEYNSEMTKAYVQFGFDTIGNAISYTTAYGKLVEGAQKVYDIAKAAYFNNKVIYTWFETYGVLTKDITESVNKAVGIAMGESYSYKVASSFLIPAALADEIADTETLSQYYAAAGTYGIYSDLKEIGDLMLELEPDNDELEAIVQNLEQDIKEVKTTVDQLEPEVRDFVTAEEKAGLKGDPIEKTTNTSINLTEDQYIVIAIISGFCILVIAIVALRRKRK